MLNTLLAATTYSSYNYDQSSAAVTSMVGAVSVMYILMMCLYFLMLAYSLFGMVISVLSLIDIANRSKEEIADKTTWVLLIYPFGGAMLFIPSMIYYFSKRKKFK